MTCQFLIKLLLFLNLVVDNSGHKRIVYHSDSDVLQVVSALQKEVAELRNKTAELGNKTAELGNKTAELGNKTTEYERKVATLESNEKASQSKIRVLESELTEIKKKSSLNGVTYVRWGRTTCPGNGTDIIYKGRMTGAHYTESGNGANSLCLPDDPTWSKYIDGNNGISKIYGTEIELPSQLSMALFGKDTYDQDIPCAVCKSTRSSHVMLPARANCYPGWKEEYSGYIVSSRPSQGKLDYVCLDAGLEFAPHGAGNDDDHVVFPVEVQCGNPGSLPCPPYVDGRELACVVCTK